MQICINVYSTSNYFHLKLCKNANIVNFVYYGKTRVSQKIWQLLRDPSWGPSSLDSHLYADPPTPLPTPHSHPLLHP